MKAAEIWFCRRILRVKWTDRRTDESVKLLLAIRRRKLKYDGHAIRNQTTDLMSSILQGKVEGKRKAVYITNTSGMKLKDLIRINQDRESWRQIIFYGLPV